MADGFIPFLFNFGEEHSLIRQLFVKKHKGQNEIKPEDRTIYIINVPQFFNKKCLKHLFLKYGPIERVYVHMKPTDGEEENRNSKSSFCSSQTSKRGCKVAYIVYKRSTSVKKVLESNGVNELPKCLFHSTVGKNRWNQQYNNSFVDQMLLQEEIRTFLQEYDAKVEEKLKEASGEPDDEGWITVSKFSKKPKIPRIESVNKKIIDKRNAAQSKLTLMKFYKNQFRDEKMEEIIELRKKFEKDKARIAMMRKSRKFKPF